MSDSADNTIDELSDFLASDPIPSRPDVSASDGSVFTAVSLVTLGLGDWGGDASRSPRFNDESLEPRPLPPDRFFNATASSALLRLWLLTRESPRESRLLIPFLESVSLAGSSVISPVVLVVGFITPPVLVVIPEEKAAAADDVRFDAGPPVSGTAVPLRLAAF